MTQQLTLTWVLHAFPILYQIIFFLSPVLLMINQSMKATVDFERKIGAQIDELMKNPEALETAEHEIVYHHLMKRHPNKGRHEIPARESLLFEGVSLVIAGSDTVAGTLTVGVFHVLRDDRVSSTLIEELEAAWPDKDTAVKFEVLEKLPYLVGFLLWA